jgi:dTDP-4-dehydrorhamnose reductase
VAIEVTSSRPTVLVIGATGQVGREQVLELDQESRGVDVVGAARSSPHPTHRFELERPESIARLISATRPNFVVMAAAATNVAWCEEHPDASRQLNVAAVAAAATASREADAKLTFISTDYVFDGIRGPYDEDGATNPINVYGAHKLEAETAVLGADDRNLVVRTCQVFGNDPRRANFVLRLADRLKQGEVVEVAGDLFGTPTFAVDLARNLIDLTLGIAAGVWHVAGSTFLSRYELACRSASAFGYSADGIIKIASEEMHEQVNRPRRAGLVTGRLAIAGMGRFTPLDDALQLLALGSPVR